MLTNSLPTNYNLLTTFDYKDTAMDLSQILQAILAFVFVLGLMFITLWLLKFCQQKGLNCHLGKCFGDESKIKILEHRHLDAKNSIVLIEYKSEEFLLLLGASTNLLLKQTAKETSSHD